MSELGKGITEFTVNLYTLFKSGEKNVIMSPYSVVAALLLANLGANERTEQQIRSALGLEHLTKEDVHKAYKLLQDSLHARSQGTTTLAVANRMFARLGLEVSKQYVDDSNKYYDTDLQLMDFIGKPEESRNEINAWVEKQTRHKIKDLLPGGSINSMSLMVLVNAIYFKGKWFEPFKADRTTKADFHVSQNVTKKVDMMNAKFKVKYLEDADLGCTAVQIPYQDGNVAMIFILPQQHGGLREFEDGLTAEKVQTLLSNFAQSGRPEVILGIPKFKMEANYDLTTAVPTMGVTDMFDPRIADFSNMLPNNRDAHVTDIVHKAFIEVNEEGTEAAAATAMMMLYCMSIPLQPKTLILDHPFMFMILDTKTNTVLFIGRYVQPPE